MKNKIILSILSLSILAAAPAVQAKRQGPQAVTVVTEQVQIHQVSQSLSLVGKIEAEQSVVISSEVTGRVDVIAFKANQEVKKDQLLVQLNDDKAKASVAEAKAYLKDEERKLKEFERLVKRNAITQTEIDAQKASVEIAQARLDAVNANLNDLNITAPFSGTVGFIDFSPGKLVSAGDELVALDDLSLMQLDLQVPERYLSQISKGMKVTATTAAWNDTVFNGEVVGIDSRINEETLNLRVRIHFDNPKQSLKPGMLVTADMDFPPMEAPIIPVQALEYSGTKRYVYMVGDDNKAVRTEVFLGARIGNQVVIEKGLDIGQKIVVQGIVNMRDGVAVSELGEDGKPLSNEQEGNS
ncbi:efflux RND transporter periplasmic adaptor subunit [Vibrio neptunius]|uniref:Efflux RND transporter periplasmic adaptor subunit n=1 Tax=Vibrio neptunius TaxID=170651 RepID=A0ABS2ZY05_9VIBR|nr:efflux RND transporter periplasmic adaptor subunit [Vibrio neptunius]MBN3494529.1 efflux RND transporter periplasmic adaptor subunit [Vibrio neptunius]MBN3513711.1 efflux RND transporter periplasmic adaptor subunit [Vibrio neptunius]MBN3548052.1 efflux RND transporter periplasmic adaptor subunit [Vibrio neptunius]MBN3576361.1 efflux RND transporter periplasmic adaptor subunit [Vibrio neptunius]MCH9870025.1 efflux RND transporter periplasmic adaptor subunit [Vibrio neptunius]